MEKRSFETIYYTVDDHVARLVLDRPDSLNSINDELLSELNTALDELENREGLRALIVEGEGDSFCSGADLEEAATKYSINAGDTTTYEDLRWIENLSMTWQRLWDFPVVTIAKVHGYCLAQGQIIVNNCDLAFATENATFGQPETAGLTPDVAYWVLTLGPKLAKELLLCGFVFSGETAEEIGLINKAVPEDELEDVIQERLDRITAASAEFVYYTKRSINSSIEILGLKSMLKQGVDHNVFTHHTEERKRFDEIFNNEGLEEAIEQEFRGLEEYE